ncbi:MAG: phosphoglycerate kinase [Thermoproteota archaeon]|nr:phosphoglycerate kinase [Thermoproteota archaeon]
MGAQENLLPKADNLLVGGATAYALLKTKGFKTGNSPIKEHLSWVTKYFLISSMANQTTYSMLKLFVPFYSLIFYRLANPNYF